MSTFQKSTRSNKGTACGRLAKTLANAIEAMGFEVSIDESRISASHYVMACREDGTLFKIRVSDHGDRYGGSDMLVGVSTAPAEAVSRVAKRLGVVVPVGYRKEDFNRRSDAAYAAAATRAKNAAEETEHQVEDLKAACDTAGIKIPYTDSGVFTVKLRKAGIEQPEGMTTARWKEVRATLCYTHGVMNAKQREKAKRIAAMVAEARARAAMDARVQAYISEHWPEDEAAAETAADSKTRCRMRRALRERARKILQEAGA